MTWFVYIIQSDTTGRLYTGITNHLERRLHAHNETSRGAKYTRIGRPWRFVHTEPQESKIHAMKRERAIKKLSRAEKLRLFEPHREIEKRAAV